MPSFSWEPRWVVGDRRISANPSCAKSSRKRNNRGRQGTGIAEPLALGNREVKGMRCRRIALIACSMLIGCSGTDSSASFFNERLACPPPAEAQFEPWSESGRQQVCKIKHGPFVIWDGHINVRGQYDMGRKVGVWRWYDAEGNVTSELHFPETSRSQEVQ